MCVLLLLLPLNRASCMNECYNSGYGISARALTAVIRAHDGRGPQTMLTPKILETLGLASADELIG